MSIEILEHETITEGKVISLIEGDFTCKQTKASLGKQMKKLSEEMDKLKVKENKND